LQARLHASNLIFSREDAATMVPGGCAEDHRGRRPARTPDGPATDGGTMTAGSTGDRSGRGGRRADGALEDQRAGFDPRHRARGDITRGSCPRKRGRGTFFPYGQWPRAIASIVSCALFYASPARPGQGEAVGSVGRPTRRTGPRIAKRRPESVPEAFDLPPLRARPPVSPTGPIRPAREILGEAGGDPSGARRPAPKGARTNAAGPGPDGAAFVPAIRLDRTGRPDWSGA
jgi:hypothetical protein